MNKQQKYYNKLLSNFNIIQAPNYFLAENKPMFQINSIGEIEVNNFPCIIEYIGKEKEKNNNIYNFMRIQKKIIKEMQYRKSNSTIQDFIGEPMVKICIANTYLEAIKRAFKRGDI